MVQRSSSTLVGASATSAAVPVPTGAAIDDIAVVGIYLENGDVITPPAGFTNKVSLATSPTTQGRLEVFWKRLTAADSGTYSFTWTNATFRSGQCGLFSGRITAGDPFDGAAGTAESVAGVTTLNVSTSPTIAKGDAVGFWTNFNGGATWTAPGSYVQRQVEPVLTLNTRDTLTAGSTGSVTPTATVSDFMKAFLGVLIPGVFRVNSASISASNNTAAAYGPTLGLTSAIGDLFIVTVNSNGTHVANGMSVIEDFNGATFTTISETQLGGSSAQWQQTFYLLATTALGTATSILATPYASATLTSISVDIFRAATGTISRAVQIQSGASGTSANTPALLSAPGIGDLVLSLVSVSTGTATQPSPYRLGSGITTQVTTQNAYVLSADGTTTYGGTWTWGTSNPSALQTIAFTGPGGPAAPSVGVPAVPQLGRRFPTPMILARNVTLGSRSTATGPFSFNQSLNGTLSFTSSETLRTSKGLAGTLSFTGAVTKRLATTLAAATVSFTSSQTRAIKTNLAATLSFTSSQTRRVIKGLSATLSFTGSVTKRTTTALVGATLSFTSSQTRRTSKGLSATVSFTGSLTTATVHLFTQALNATLSFTSSQTRSIGTHLAGTLSFTSSQTRRTAKLISAGVSFTSSQTRAIKTNLAGALSFTSSQTRRTSKLLGTAVLSFTGNMTTAAVHFFTQALNASLSFTSSQTRSIGKGLAGGLSFTSSQTRRTSKLVSAGLSFTSAQTRAIKTNLAGVLSFTSSQTRRTSKLLGTAVLSFTGNLATAAVHFFTQALNATLSFTGSLTTRRVFAKALSASLSFTSSQTKQTVKFLTAGLSFTGSQTKRIAKTISAALGLTGLLNLLTSLVATKGTASAAQMSVADSTPGSTTTPGSSAASGVVPEAFRGSGTVPTSDAGNATGPTSSAP